MNKADALKIVLELVARFEEQLPALKNAKYKEHNLRMEFLNPFWEALGWDGTYKGEDFPSGVFSYLLEYKVNRHTYFKSGEVLLVR